MKSENGPDSLAFDCDGVLVDSRRSYDEAILRVTDSLTREAVGLRLPWRRAGPPLIERLRMTGGFNNDWDTTYALTVMAAAARGRGGARSARDIKSIVRRMNSIAADAARLRSPIGPRAVEAAVARANGNGGDLVKELKDRLGYPGDPPGSFLAAKFDEAYYGGALYREIYGAEPANQDGRGLIENERVLVRADDLRSLRAHFSGKMALVTGRTTVATRHTLGGLMDLFDLEASTFVGDGFRELHLGRDPSEYSKPSPLGLLKAMDSMGAASLLYVGDSGEDALMAEKARERGRSVAFVGISGDEKSRRSFFRAHGARLVLESVNELRDALRSGETG